MEPVTLSEAIDQLKTVGYSSDLNLEARPGSLVALSMKAHPEDFQIDKYYRFEGATDPEDESIVYAISSAKHRLKGILINAFGAYSDSAIDDMVRAVKEKTIAIENRTI